MRAPRLRHRCGRLCRAARAARGAAAAASPVVDIHSHFLPREVPDWAGVHGGADWPGIRHGGELPEGTYGYGRPCAAMLTVGGRDFRPVTLAAFDAAARVADLDRFGVQHQLVSATPLLFQWQREGAVGLEVARRMNGALLELCAHPAAQGRLHPLCQVPLQDIDAACTAVTEAKASGHRGVQIGNHVGAKDLDDDGLVAFLQHCASEDFPVLVHPWDMDPVGGRTAKYMMGWTVGMPMETHLSVTAMILGGSFDRLPSTLRLCFAHGGGAFPYLLGRLENAWLERSVARGVSEKPPSHYLDRFYVDSAVFDQRALRLLVDTMGADRIMLGSDYPFPLGEQRIAELVRGADCLSESDRAAVLGGTAARFFSLPVV
eukprot:TRINITY_DN29584_c0_g1_i1.p1 TRINITY_DN29584_c0_g1~~TRINITY_DN29584_c0_g1_i1.p1  ORF type:complete len:375 (+),score=88.61 TRINITY_DN29584_c0_g1_i1:81-1205(+)